MKICGKCLPKVTEATHQVDITIERPGKYGKTYERYETDLCEEHFNGLNAVFQLNGLLEARKN